jgi:hypothetical protein
MCAMTDTVLLQVFTKQYLCYNILQECLSIFINVVCTSVHNILI